MNPTMLEASDDLTNLSHLNEPAGMLPTTRVRTQLVLACPITLERGLLTIPIIQSCKQFA